MNNGIRFISARNKEGQMLFVFVSTLFLFISILFLLLSFTYYLLLLTLLEAAVLVAVILFFRRFYDITIHDDIVTASNIWGTKKIAIDGPVKIRLFIFNFPYPFNPFITIQFGKYKLVTKVPGATRIYSSKGGVNSYIRQLELNINHQIKESENPR